MKVYLYLIFFPLFIYPMDHQKKLTPFDEYEKLSDKAYACNFKNILYGVQNKGLTVYELFENSFKREEKKALEAVKKEWEITSDDIDNVQQTLKNHLLQESEKRLPYCFCSQEVCEEFFSGNFIVQTYQALYGAKKTLNTDLHIDFDTENPMVTLLKRAIQIKWFKGSGKLECKVENNRGHKIVLGAGYFKLDESNRVGCVRYLINKMFHNAPLRLAMLTSYIAAEKDVSISEVENTISMKKYNEFLSLAAIRSSSRSLKEARQMEYLWEMFDFDVHKQKEYENVSAEQAQFCSLMHREATKVAKFVKAQK